MLHSFVRNYLHITWSTKNRDRVFTGSSKIELKDFILEKSKEIQCPVLAINVQPEHIHFLIDLPADLCLSDLTRKIKGSSSHWLNEQNLIQEEYIEWKKNYGFFDD